jgi:hypothetical protein
MAIEEITQTPTRLSSLAHPAKTENTGFSADKMVLGREVRGGAPKTAESDYSFWDFIDLINPLQHIPVVNTVYRAVTGDTIKPEMKLAGGAALGGVFGLVTSLADVIFEQETGKDIGTTMVASVFGEGEAAPVQTASLAQEAADIAPAAGNPNLDLQAALQPVAPMPLPSVTGSKEKNERDEREQRLAMIDPMDKHVLELYGKSSPTVAAQAYNQANMRGYLQQASLNQTF